MDPDILVNHSCPYLHGKANCYLVIHSIILVLLVPEDKGNYSYKLSKYQKLLTQQHTITSQNTNIQHHHKQSWIEDQQINCGTAASNF
jgi:hypothetical protein